MCIDGGEGALVLLRVKIDGTAQHSTAQQIEPLHWGVISTNLPQECGWC